MTQQAIIEILKEKPGTLQCDMLELTGLKAQSISHNVRRLERWGKLKRIRVPKRWSYALYLLE